MARREERKDISLSGLSIADCSIFLCATSGVVVACGEECWWVQFRRISGLRLCV